MKKSVRALRMERNHKRMAKTSKLSLVSLMDIFTILVFFLMFNASDVQVLQNHQSVKLPASSSEQAAEESLVLLVNAEELSLQGRKLAEVPAVIASEQQTIAALQQELEYHRNRVPRSALTSQVAENDAPLGRAITIMGDQTIPYALLKKIMQTCAQAGYTNISLAVEQAVGTGASA